MILVKIAVPLILASGIVGLVLLAVLLPKEKEDPTLVRTLHGPIRGSRRSTKVSNRIFYAFTDIPYAEPPIGNRRFQAPLPYGKNWTKELKATSSTSFCIQATASGQEDCLYLNIYTLNPFSKKKYPVMVWIYGGAFITGDARYQTAPPDNFLDQDVVFVTFNYRLGILGFLSTNDSVIPGNAGLKDQVLALKWIKQNIEFFGGDPDNIVVFGESAGATSISYLLQVDETKGLFHKAIMQSGSSLCPWGLSRNKKNSLLRIAKSLGIKQTDPGEIIKELLALDGQKLQSISTKDDLIGMLFGNPLDGLWFSPSIEPDVGEALINFKSYLKLSKGDFHHIPVIIGHNSLEAKIAQELQDLFNIYMILFQAFPEKLVPTDMNYPWPLSIFLGQTLMQKYFPNNNFSSENIVKVSFNITVQCDHDRFQFISLDQFIRPINKHAEMHSKFAPSYFYQFSYDSLRNQKEGKLNGVGHAEELPYLFGENSEDWNEDDWMISRNMVKLWTSFAKDSTPKLDHFTWPLYNKSSLIDIGKEIRLIQNPYLEELEYWDDLYDSKGNPPFDTY